MRFISIMLTAILVVSCVSGCSKQQSQANANAFRGGQGGQGGQRSQGGQGGYGGGGDRPIAVEVAPVETGNIIKKLSMSGNILPWSEVNVFSRVSGNLLKEIYVDEGNFVKAGQVLARVDHEDIDAQIEQAKADLEATKATLAKSEALSKVNVDSQVKQAEAILERLKASALQSKLDIEHKEKQLELQIKKATVDEKIAKARLDVLKSGTKDKELEQLKVKKDNAQNELKRQKVLYEKGFTSQREVEAAQLAYDIVSAQVSVLEKENPADIEISEHQFLQAQIALQTAESNKLQLDAERKSLEAAEARVKESDASLQQALAAQSAKTWQKEIDLAKANVRRAEASLKLAEQRLQYCTITAPISGVITERNLDPGDMVTSAIGRFTAIVTIANIDSVRVTSNIAEREINLIRVGSEAKIKADAYPNREFVGEVIQISPIVDQATRTAKIEIKVPNSEHLLKPGMFVRIDLVLDERNNVVLVPKHAIKTQRGKDGDKKGVFLVNGDKASFVTIPAGLESDESVEVISGLKPGDMIVVSGHQSGGLRDGSKVIVTNK